MRTPLTNPPKPGSEQWKKIISASKIAPMIRNAAGEYAGYGYITPIEAWRQLVEGHEQTITPQMQEMFDEGHDAEPSAAARWLRAQRDLHPDGMWSISDGEVSFSNPELSFDNLATIDRVASNAVTGEVWAIEVKRPNKRVLNATWELQLIFQMGISGITHGTIMVDPVWGAPFRKDYEFNPAQFQAIVDDVTAFHKLVQDKTPPKYAELPTVVEERCVDEGREEVGLKAERETLERLLDAYRAEDKAAAERARLEEQLKEDMRRAKANALYAEGVKIATASAGRFAQSRVPKEHKHLLTSHELMEEKFSVKLLQEKYPEVYAQALGDPSISFARKEVMNRLG